MSNQKPTDWAALTERYYAGETSLEEEAALRRHWEETNPESGEAELAAYFKTAADAGNRASEFPSKAFSDLSFEEFALPELAISPSDSALNGRGLKVEQVATRRRLWPRLAAAASIALLMLSLWMWQPQSAVEITEGPPLAVPTDWSKYEVTDPNEALAILTGSLRQVAEPFREGAKATRPMGNLSKLNNPLPQ